MTTETIHVRALYSHGQWFVDCDRCGPLVIFTAGDGEPDTYCLNHLAAHGARLESTP